ncbi:MAG: hypothetical protein K2F99_03140 [Muribaculaceae bacterium]|nr:hypothetical protein [Muribaculaceae bacterium]
MKASKLLRIVAISAIGLATGSCADMLGVGLDYGSDMGPSVYYYDNYYAPSGPLWGLPALPPPPAWGNIVVSPPPGRPQPVRPPQAPPQNRPPQNNGNSGVSVTIPTHFGGEQRPGNGGLPSQGSQSTHRAPQNQGSNNSHR